MIALWQCVSSSCTLPRARENVLRGLQLFAKCLTVYFAHSKLPRRQSFCKSLNRHPNTLEDNALSLELSWTPSESLQPDLPHEDAKPP